MLNKFNNIVKNNRSVIGAIAIVVLFTLLWLWSANQIDAPGTASITTPDNNEVQVTTDATNSATDSTSTPGDTPTNTPTGWGNDLVPDSFLLPLALIALMLYLYFSGKLYKLSDWIERKIHKN